MTREEFIEKWINWSEFRSTSFPKRREMMREDLNNLSDNPRPPLGIKPRYIHDEERFSEIWEAMKRRSFKDCPSEWYEEMIDILKSKRGNNE